MKLLFFDLETTGTNPGRNGIHQISGQVVIDGIVKESFDFHVQPNPKAAIEDEALAVAGVTREQIAKYPAMGTVYRQFVAMLGKYVDKYNSKDKFFGSWFWANSMDVMVLVTVHLANKRTEMENFKLSTVAATLGVQVDGDSLHNAMYDIELTKTVFDIVTDINV
jgi:DNA polymerase-3 subunit epsilon